MYLSCGSDFLTGLVNFFRNKTHTRTCTRTHAHTHTEVKKKKNKKGVKEGRGYIVIVYFIGTYPAALVMIL